MKFSLFALSFISCILKINAQDIFPPPVEKLKVTAHAITGDMSIDGQLDEHFWAEATPVSDFIQVEPNQGNPSQFRTIVKVLYNDKYLYIGAICYEKNGKKRIRVPELNRDFSFRQNDTFAVGLDGFNDQRNTITLAVNPYGTQKDYLSFDDVLFDSEWNGMWKVRTSIGEDYWIAEFSVPWKTLRYATPNDLEESTNWGINFVRQRRASNEISAWSPYPRSFGFNRAEYLVIRCKADISSIHKCNCQDFTNTILLINPMPIIFVLFGSINLYLISI